MYITNPESIPEDKIYWCNGIIAEFLMYKKHLPLFSRQGRKFGFAKTEELEKAILDLPFYLKITKIF